MKRRTSEEPVVTPASTAEARAGSSGMGPVAAALPARASLSVRWRSMARTGLRMMLHDKLKMLGTLVGVVFAVVLANQQLATFMGLLTKNVLYLRNAGADVWIAPPGVNQFQPGKAIADVALMHARVRSEVAWAEPMLLGTATVATPVGGSEPVTLIGVPVPIRGGGPWNIVAGSASALSRPDTMIFEDADRDKLGGLNLGSVREVNGHKVHVGGFTYGLIPFGPSFAFASYDLARELLKTPRDRASFVMIKVKDGVDPKVFATALRSELGAEFKVLAKDDFMKTIYLYLLKATPIGITFGTSTMFGLIVGFVIVSLSMFSAVVDNLREFGTLKALGTTTADLAKLLFVQSVAYSMMGSTIGLALVSNLANAIRTPRLALVLLPQTYLGTYVVMTLLCIIASSLALFRLHRLEPAMVFR
ncbi:MAG: FtsX-like permease family protein [Deltaproteobacteria bacterium]|nr:FtsX-like permease family protein [Deltaproteobacteria bacterium]